MKKNFNTAFRKTSAGNYFGHYRGYYISIAKKESGNYSCIIGRNGTWIWSEGFLGNCLQTVKDAKQWAKFKIMPSCKTPYATK